MKNILKLLVAVTGLYCSLAHNIETGKIHSMYLRNGGNVTTRSHQEPAYAGYTFDVTLNSDVASILVGQPRSGEENRAESPGALYHCTFKFLIDEPSTTTNSSVTTNAINTTPSEFSTNPTTTTDSTTDANVTSTEDHSGNVTATTLSDQTFSTAETVTVAPDFSTPVCNKLEIFDWTNYAHRDVDHKNHADAIGLTVARLKNSSDYVVCTSLRQRQCLQGENYAPGGCYVGNPESNEHWSFKQFNEAGCYADLVEIMLVVDGSGSIGLTNFELVKSWLINVVDSLYNKFGETVKTQVIQYANRDKRKDKIPVEDSKMFVIPYTLNDALSVETISQRIKDMKYLNSLTYTNFALTRTMIEFEKSVHKDRAKKVVVVFTDGKANDGASLSRWYSDNHDKLAKIIAVGVGGQVSVSELRTIANGDVNDNGVRTVGDFDGLDGIIKDIIGDIARSVLTEGDVTPEGTAYDIDSIQLGSSIASSYDGGIYVGAVGAYKETGTVVKYDTFQSPETDIPSYKQTQEYLKGTTSDSYLGYSSVVGYFDGISSDYFIASGAPRYSLVGAVVIYKTNADSSVLNMTETITLPQNKRQVAEYFGGSLLALDVSGDGKDDLFVGASLYFKNTYDEGRVFVYFSQPSSTTQIWGSDYKPLELYGDRMQGGRFGTAIANAGDINLDGFNDVVIGAPLAEEGKGAIYIYYGKDGGIEKNFAQKILASSLSDKTLKYFGQFIQGNIDIDNNKYPDLFVGAPRSDTVVILRSRPIAKIFATMEFTTPDIDLSDCIRKEYVNCTSLKICLVVRGTFIDPIIGMQYKMTLDTEQTNNKKKRLFFSSVHDSNKIINIDTNKTNCFVHWISMEKKITDLETSVAARLDFDIHPSHTAKLLTTVRDLSQNTTVSKFIYFAKDCKEQICRHDLHIDTNLTLPTFRGFASEDETSELDYSNLLIIESPTASLMQVTLSNNAEKAFKTTINVTYTSQISLSGLSRRTSNVAPTLCIVEYGEPIDIGNGLKTQIYRYNSLENIMLSKSWCYFEFNLITDDLKLYGSLSSISVKIVAYSNSSSGKEVDSSDNSREISRGVFYRSDYSLRKESSNKEIPIKNSTNITTTISSVEEIGNSTDDVEMYFRISGLGYSNIPLTDITMKWPTMTKSGRPLLYLYKLACYREGLNDVNNKATCNCDETKVNPLHLSVDGSDENGTAIVTPANTSLGMTEIDCNDESSGNFTCESLKCNLTNMGTNDFYFVALFRLWTPSFNFTEDKRSVLLKTQFNISTSRSPLIIDENGNRKTVKTEEVITTAKMYTELMIFEAELTTLEIVFIVVGSMLGAHELLRATYAILLACGFFDSKYAELAKEAKDAADDELDYEEVGEIKKAKQF